MKKKNRLFSFALLAVALTLTLCCVFACSGNKGTEPEDSTGESNATTAGDNTGTGESTSETNPPSTPAVERVPDTRNLSAADYSVYQIVGTDDFGRVISPVDGKINKDRYVGMFFFLTLGQHANHTGIYDINKITYEGTNIQAFSKYDTMITPVGSAHFWGEPVFGYYNSEDPWVMRKQVEMLTMAGVDFLVLDTSNNVLYDTVTAKLFSILKEYQDAGWNVPRVVYYLGTGANETVLRQAYAAFYGNETYKSLWFTPNDPEKPMIIAPSDLIAELQSNSTSNNHLANFFDFRVTQWPTEKLRENGAPWIDFKYPQTSQQGWISLSVAQHVTTNMTDTVNSRGRGWTPTEQKKNGKWDGVNDHENWRMNLNLQAQWNTVLNMSESQKATDARFVFLTGWNEWVAEKLRAGIDNYFTCDTFNAEYSRDIEPSRSSGMKDYAYFLTVMNIHKDNYAPAVHYEYPVATPDISKDDTEVWSQSTAVYRDFTGECEDRNFKAMAGNTVYTDQSGRNDIDTVTILHDTEYLYFRITCTENITAYKTGDSGWMNLWIKTQNADGALMGGYEYLINRSVLGGRSEILRCRSEEDMQSVGEALVNIYGNVMIVRIPLSALGLTAEEYAFEFKVTDNVQDMINDPLNLYCTGDTAPVGTFNFSYGY